MGLPPSLRKGSDAGPDASDPIQLALGAAAGALLAVPRRRRPHRGRTRQERPPAAAHRWSAPATAEVTLTTHAVERAAQPGVAKQELDRTVRAPHRSRADDRQGSVRLERDFGVRTLKVWVLPHEQGVDRVVVKTTAWTHHRTLVVAPGTASRIIGDRGARVRVIEARSGARVSVGRDGRVRITGDSAAVVDEGLAHVRAAVRGVAR